MIVAPKRDTVAKSEKSIEKAVIYSSPAFTDQTDPE
jgi:hypothetical protein